LKVVLRFPALKTNTLHDWKPELLTFFRFPRPPSPPFSSSTPRSAGISEPGKTGAEAFSATSFFAWEEGILSLENRRLGRPEAKIGENRPLSPLLLFFPLSLRPRPVRAPASSPETLSKIFLG